MYNVVALVVSAVSACFAAAAWVTRRQMLRLELYKRRFDIYSRVLDLAGALLEWNTADEQAKLQSSPELMKRFEAFLKANVETRFLFGADSGIKDVMDDLARTASEIIGYQWHAPESAFYLSPQAAPAEQCAVRENHKRFYDLIPRLEESLSKYLNFRAL